MQSGVSCTKRGVPDGYGYEKHIDLLPFRHVERWVDGSQKKSRHQLRLQ